MKTSHKILFAMLIAMSFSACKKEFLEINPQQQTDVDMVVVDLPSTRAAVIGTYSLMGGSTYYGRSVIVLPEVLSDNLYLSRRNSGRYTAYDQYIATQNDSYANSTWNTLYRTVVNANIIISKGEQLSVPNADLPEMKHLLGEAYTIRALALFDLLRLYALPYNVTANANHIGIPVILKNGTDKSNVISPKRNTVKEGYTQIVADLQKAITLMPTTPVGFSASNKGHISHYAAKGLLARVYLYMEDWVNAEIMAGDVITSNKYTLLNNANYVSGTTNFRNQNNSETIFELVYNTTNNLGSDALVAFLLQGGSYGDGLATDDLYNRYTATDVRRGFMAKGKRSGSGGEDPAITINKYNNTTTYEEGAKVIRLSELYLIRAEARAKQTGKDALAAADLDVIAKRADASKITTTAVGTALQTLILDENRKEFAFEGHRLFDLTRNKLNFTKYRTDGITLPIANTSLRTILPIPLSEMNSNPNMEQNEAYKTN